MRSIFGVCLAFVLVARLVECLRGGRWVRNGEFPFLVRIEKSNYTWCLGSILDSERIIVPDDCLRKSPLIGYASANVIPIVNGAPLRKYTGRFVNMDHSAVYTELDVIVIRLDPPGLELAEWHQQNVSRPKRVIIGRPVPGKSDVVVVGLNRRVGAMTILDDFECFNRLGNLYFPMNDRLQSTKVLLGEKLMCAVLKNTTGNVGDVPPGQACERDLGAPVIQDGALVGVVVRSFCLKNFPSVVLISRQDSSDESRKSLERNLEQNPQSPSPINEEPARLKRQSSIENAISKGENEIRCRGCDVPAEEAAASGTGSINPSVSAPMEQLDSEAFPESSHPNGEVAKRLRRRSLDVRSDTTAGNGIECHECKEPETKVVPSGDGLVNTSETASEEKLPYVDISLPDGDAAMRLIRQSGRMINDDALIKVPAPGNGSVNPSEASPEEKLLYDKTSIPSGEVAKRLIRQSRSMINDAFHKVTVSGNVSGNPSESRPVRQFLVRREFGASKYRLLNLNESVPNPRNYESSSPNDARSAGSECLESSCEAPAVELKPMRTVSVSQPRVSRDAAESNESIAEDRHRGQLSNGNWVYEVNKIIQTGIVHRSPVGSNATGFGMKQNVEVFIPIPEQNLVQDRNRKLRHRRDADPAVNVTANATAPGANMAGNMTGNTTSASNGTEKLNGTKPVMNGTAPEGNATAPGGIIGDSKGNGSKVNASVPSEPLHGNGTKNNSPPAVNGTTPSTPTVTDGQRHGNKTGSKNGSINHDDGAVEMGSGKSNDTEDGIVLSGGDFDMGLERFGGSGNETSGSGSVDIVSGFGESAQDEIHKSEEELGPAKKPPKKPTHQTTPKTTQRAPPEPNEPEVEGPVGPPAPNDDRPDYSTPKTGKVRQANFSPRNIPFCYSLLATIPFVVSFIC